jgi:hypothetical protein
MDKLKPILAQKFWIIGVVALLVPLIGWWMDTSGMAERIDARTTTLDALNPDALVDPSTPNGEYVTALQGVNDIHAKRQRELEKKLFEEQKELRTWPKQVDPVMSGLKYRDPVDIDTRARYRQVYIDHFNDMVETTIQPYVPADMFRKESGIVAIGDQQQSQLTQADYYPAIHRIHSEQEWQYSPPNSQEMWDAQEDIWLVRSLLEAVALLNRDATRIGDAPIRQIIKLELRGGSRKPETPPGTADPMAAEGGSNGAPGMEMPNFGMGGGLGMGDPDGGGFGSQTASASFANELDKVFGPAVEPVAATGADGMPAPESSSPTMMMPEGPGAGGLAGQKLRRYVDDDPALPYKTRGFYLELRMRHEDLPRFQAALVSLDWPTTLLRVQQVSLYHDFEQVPLVAGGGGAGMERGGFRRPPGGGGFNPRIRPMPPGGRGFGPGADGLGGEGAVILGRQDDTQQQDSLAVALQEPYMAHVAIAGLMTIYRSPEIDEEAIEENAQAEEAAEAADPNAVPPAPVNPDGTPQPTPEGEPTTTPNPMDTPTAAPSDATAAPANTPAGTTTPTPPVSPPADNPTNPTPEPNTPANPSP